MFEAVVAVVLFGWLAAINVAAAVAAWRSL